MRSATSGDSRAAYGTDESKAFERRTLWLAVAYAALGGLLVTPLWGWLAALSLLLGAAVVVLNFWVLARTVAALIQSRAVRAWGVVYALKLLVVGAGFYALFKADWVAVLPFVLGLGAVPISIALSQLFSIPGSSPSAPSSVASSSVASRPTV